MEALSRFYGRFRWSPWETNEYMHCGVRVKEGEDEFILEQSEYSASMDQVKFEKRDEKLPATPEEVTQLRGVLGAIQWRAYSTAPQHMATLSMLQSQTSKATVGTLQQANKLAREVYAQRHMCIRILDLQIDPDDVTFVAWSDAAVGNRPDLGSTGGYIIAATTPNVTEAHTIVPKRKQLKDTTCPFAARRSQGLHGMCS
ncbi:GIP [Symbiodinium sp. CCMP2456]|nr:GIP [Symbiodinium sp. CCMP2456]